MGVGFIRTASEIAASATPVDYTYVAGDLLRYGKNTSPGTTDMSAAFQAAMDSAAPDQGRVLFSNTTGLSKPILFKPTNDQGITIEGMNKANSVFEPLAVDIQTLAQKVNTCLFIQNNNAHLRMINFGTHATVGYTGNIVFCVEGGGFDGSGQCLFSGIFRDGFVIMPTTNSGYLKGTTQNCLWDGVTFENLKSVFTHEGPAHIDNHYNNISLCSIYDEFVRQNADTNGSLFSHYTNINDYQRCRGVAFDVKNWQSCSINQYALEARDTSLPADNVGFGKFTDCQFVTIDNVQAVSRPGVTPTGITILEFAGSGTTKMKVAQSYLQGVTGVKVSSTGAVKLDFHDMDLSTAGSSCFDVSGAVAAGSVIRTSVSRFNDAQIRCLVHSAANNVSHYSFGDEFINAGLGGAAGARNIDLSTGGESIFCNPRIGRDNGSAAAAYFIELAAGTTATLIHPRWVGAAPNGKKTGAGTLKVVPIPARVGVTYGASMTFDAADGTHFKIVPNNATAFAIAAPLNPSDGQSITVRIKNATGGALGAVTWNGVFKMSAWTQPASGFSRTIRFTYDSTDSAWVQEGGPCVDVPN